MGTVHYPDQGMSNEARFGVNAVLNQLQRLTDST
jgi:hypothetical protein